MFHLSLADVAVWPRSFSFCVLTVSTADADEILSSRSLLGVGICLEDGIASLDLLFIAFSVEF